MNSKPKFVRQDSNKMRRIGTGWRKPKGIHSKMRNCFRGHRSIVCVGWKSSKETRGLVNGLENILVFTLKQLEAISPKVQGISISNSVGLRKKTEIINKAKE